MGFDPGGVVPDDFDELPQAVTRKRNGIVQRILSFPTKRVPFTQARSLLLIEFSILIVDSCDPPV